MPATRDHGGGVDAAVRRFGGARGDWIDLSTGINPVPYPLPAIPAQSWATLPDHAAQDALIKAARAFWNVPKGADILATNGASAPIAAIPLLGQGAVRIDAPTYNEHAAAFAAANWQISSVASDARVVVHPNNPTGAFWDGQGHHKLLVIDESFCDIAPTRTLIARAAEPDTLILKSFGKFWGLAGLRLGFVIGDPVRIARLREMLGPWPVSGPALHIATKALNDPHWADATRARLCEDAKRLDAVMLGKDANLVGGTDLFRLYEVEDAAKTQGRLARAHIWSRIFPYSKTYIRLGLPAPNDWARIEAAL